MHKVYGKYAEYIDPNAYNFIFKEEHDKKADMEGLLEKYSWKKSAEIIYNIIL